jgi:hypothetical protein
MQYPVSVHRAHRADGLYSWAQAHFPVLPMVWLVIPGALLSEHLAQRCNASANARAEIRTRLAREPSMLTTRSMCLAVLTDRSMSCPYLIVCTDSVHVSTLCTRWPLTLKRIVDLSGGQITTLGWHIGTAASQFCICHGSPFLFLFLVLSETAYFLL